MASAPSETLRAAARGLLDALVGLTGPVRVCDAGGGVVCLIQAWPAGGPMPRAAAETAAEVPAGVQHVIQVHFNTQSRSTEAG